MQKDFKLLLRNIDLEGVKADAARGISKAQFILAWLYKTGRGGLKQNYSYAFRWYKEAAEQGDKRAQQDLCVMYFKGYGIQKDYDRAVEWAKKAAFAGNPNSQLWLGLQNAYGRGTPVSRPDAFAWLLVASCSGYRIFIRALMLTWLKIVSSHQEIQQANVIASEIRAQIQRDSQSGYPS